MAPANVVSAPASKEIDRFSFLTAMALVAGGVGMLFLPWEWLPRTTDFLPEQIESLGVYDSARQRAAHKIWVIATFVTCALILFSNTATSFGRGWKPNRVRALAPIVSLSIIVLSYFWYFRFPEAALEALSLALIAITVIAVVLPKWHRIQLPTIGSFWLLGVIIIYFLLMFMPGFLAITDTDLPFLVQSFDHHYSVVLGSIERLRAGGESAANASFNYGVLSSWTGAQILDAFGAQSVGAYVRLVQFFGFLFAILLVMAAWLWSKRNKSFTLFVAAVATPWVGALHVGVWHPNASGWRVLGFPVFLLVLLLLHSLPRPIAKAVVAGIASAILVLWNVETGIACTIGLGFLVLLTSYERNRNLATIAVNGCIMIGTLFIAVVVILLATVGTIALKDFDLFFNFTSGYGGLRIGPDILALGIALAATYAVVRATTIARFSSPSARAIEHGALGFVLLIWFAYFLNRPHPWNLWTFIVLGPFLFEHVFTADFWRSRNLGIRTLATQPGLFAILLCLFFLPVWINLDYARQKPPASFAADANLSGLSVPPELAEKAKTQSALIEELNGHGDLIYITSVPFLMSILSEQQSGLSIFDPFNETWTETQYHQLREEISRKQPDRLLIDSPDNIFLESVDLQQKFFERLRASLVPEFRLVDTRAGWQIWKPNEGATLQSGSVH